MRRVEWIIKVVDPRVKRWGATYKLAQCVGADTAARWEREARRMRPSGLKRRLQEHQN